MFQVDISLNLDELKEEIEFLHHLRVNRTGSALSRRSEAVISKETDTRQSGPFERCSESIALLMEWVNAVCAFYNQKVHFLVFL